MNKKKFTPMKVYTDKVAFRQAEQRAEQKINILNDAFPISSRHKKSGNFSPRLISFYR